MARFTAVVFLLIAAAQASNVPAPVGALVGAVSDRDGAVPGATISVIVATSTKTAITNASGKYRIEGIPVGTYRAEARVAGFMPRRAEVKILAGQVTSWDPVVAIRTAHSNAPPVGTDPTDRQLAAGVYEAILRSVYRGQVPSQPTIVIKSLIQPYLDDRDWPSELAAVPLELRQRSRSADALRAVRLRPDSLPSGARLVESADLADVPFTALSRAFATVDGLNALVVFEHRCGNLCGEGTVAWLARETASATWTIRRTFTFWVSSPRNRRSQSPSADVRDECARALARSHGAAARRAALPDSVRTEFCTGQRFNKISRPEDLTVFADPAAHSFGRAPESIALTRRFVVTVRRRVTHARKRLRPRSCATRAVRGSKNRVV